MNDDESKTILNKHYIFLINVVIIICIDRTNSNKMRCIR